MGKCMSQLGKIPGMPELPSLPEVDAEKVAHKVNKLRKKIPKNAKKKAKEFTKEMKKCKPDAFTPEDTHFKLTDGESTKDHIKIAAYTVVITKEIRKEAQDLVWEEMEPELSETIGDIPAGKPDMLKQLQKICDKLVEEIIAKMADEFTKLLESGQKPEDESESSDEEKEVSN